MAEAPPPGQSSGPASRAGVAAIVLAAGSSSRLGRPKQLLDLGGRPVLVHVVQAVQAAPLDEVVVVLGHRAEEVRAALQLGLQLPPEGPGLRIVLNPEHADGQSTSLKAGLQALDGRMEAAVILLGDQPGVRPDAIRSVVEAWRADGGTVVQASYGQKPGHPTLLSRRVWSEMSSVEGDEGARSVLSRHPEWITAVEVGGLPPEDIDTEADYLRVREAFANAG
jgi:molybdenum cofactor cytidylyltransferase